MAEHTRAPVVHPLARTSGWNIPENIPRHRLGPEFIATDSWAENELVEAAWGFFDRPPGPLQNTRLVNNANKKNAQHVSGK